MPKFRQLEKDELILTLEKALEKAKTMSVDKDCASCAYADRSGVKILCKWVNQYPPEDVQAVGCEAYFYDATTPPF